MKVTNTSYRRLKINPLTLTTAIMAAVYRKLNVWCQMKMEPLEL